MFKIRFLLAAAMLFSAAMAQGADLPADIDLRQAARLHRGGDTPAAVAIWKKWAQQDNVDAAYNLAVIHQYADGVAYDATEAMRWYRVAAERGDKASQFQIGLMYQNGEGVPVDQSKAHEWFTKNRQEHWHHYHNARLQEWRQQALALIEARDRREAAAIAKRDGELVLADLKRRAGLSPTTVKMAAAVSR